AKEMADAAGVKLGRLRSLTETPSGGPVPYAFAQGAAGSPAGAKVPVEAGTQELTLLVTVVYDIAQ
ncbi:MAG: SIMPL domain-containing protein, partial [Acidimicrobiia bacterium]